MKMSYDSDFYTAYAAYLQEPTVREAHDWVFAIAASTVPALSHVVDLGCGQFNEYYQHAQPKKYLGIDVNVEPSRRPGQLLVQADYRTADLKSIIGRRRPTGFVSLFSCENTAPVEDNYRFYRNLFDQFGFKAGLVSGFFYSGSRDINPIGEAGGIQSFQMLENIEDVRCKEFVERRIVLPVPSKLFGANVYEGWKIFVAR
jgi:hypothetical protein